MKRAATRDIIWKQIISGCFPERIPWQDLGHISVLFFVVVYAERSTAVFSQLHGNTEKDIEI